MRSIREILISVVLPLEDTGPFIAEYIRGLNQILSDNFDHYEVLLVDNRSRDDTAQVVQSLQKQHANITYFELTRRMNIAVTTVVGLDHSIGDLVVILDPRLDPPELVVEMANEAIKGFEIVYAIPQQERYKRSLYGGTEALFLKFLSRMNGIDLPSTFPSARLFSRSVLNYLLQTADRHLILSIAPSLSGHPASEIPYQRTSLDQKTASERYSWRQSVMKGVNLTLAASPRPLRIVSVMALVACALAIIYSIYTFIFWLLSDDVAPGWTSLSLQISGLFFFVCLLLALMSEYLQQILESVERRPLYLIRRHSASETMNLAQDLNIVDRQ